ncbi:MAG: hypothetical protein QXD77_03280 [Candidatus Aenigmatarchaeota archaeon]
MSRPASSEGGLCAAACLFACLLLAHGARAVPLYCLDCANVSGAFLCSNCSSTNFTTVYLRNESYDDILSQLADLTEKNARCLMNANYSLWENYTDAKSTLEACRGALGSAASCCDNVTALTLMYAAANSSLSECRSDLLDANYKAALSEQAASNQQYYAAGGFAFGALICYLYLNRRRDRAMSQYGKRFANPQHPYNPGA